MDQSYYIMTDSGGIQEEAPTLGKPTLVLRETTERPEAIEAGTAKLIGTQEEKVYQAMKELETEKYAQMSEASNPFGDGKASQRIVEFLKKRHYS
jgi:UDP-N-acetylglucosamine 2-epimerase (non-hydrolysing)